MKCLSVQQPFAWLICNNFKDVENRTWATKYRGPLLIHASLKVDTEMVAILWEHWGKQEVDLPERFDTGSIVGIVDMVDCVTESESEWFDGPYGFVLANPQPLPPLPYKGKLGLWEVPTLPTEQVAAMQDKPEDAIREIAQRQGIGQKIGHDWQFTEEDIVALYNVRPPGHPAADSA